MRRDASGALAATAGRCFQLATVLVVVTVQAQQFPVAAIRRIVVMVVVPMMDRQLAQIGAREFASAPAADPRIYPERLLAVSLFALGRRAAGVGDDAIELAGV